MGARGRIRVGQLEKVLARHLVRRAPLLQVAREQGLQDAHPGAALQVPGLHRMPLVPRHAPQARRDAVEDRRSEEHTSELQSQSNLVCRLLLEKKNNKWRILL